jgi:adenylate kinase
MNKTEKLHFQRSIESYFEEKRVYDLFEKLLREIIVNKPKDPVAYMTDYIKKKKDISRIFITGTAGTSRKEISLAIGNDLGYACISVGDIIQKELNKKLETSRRIEKNFENFNLIDDDIVIDLVRKELIKYEKENKSYILEGFPKNRVNILYNYI